MKTSVFLVASFVVTMLASSSAFALLKIQTFETQPEFEEPEPLVDPLPEGTWGVQQDGLNNVDELNGILLTPFWNNGGGGSGGSDGWLTTVGTETPLNNRGPIGGINYAHIPTTAVLTNLFTGVLIYDNGSWGDVSTATFLTMDVKGSFAGSGGISVYVHGDSSTLWSWTAAVSNEAVGANPGDVTEWTTILIPINKPTVRNNDAVFPSVDGMEGHIDGDIGTGVTHTTSGLAGGGNWGVNENYASDEEMIEAWDITMASVDRIDVRGLTPDSQIDNLGFILPDVGLPGDFDLDDDVDGADFLLWQQDMSVGNLADWEANFGTVAAVAAVGAVAAVPEPTAITLTLAGVVALASARRRRPITESF